MYSVQDIITAVRNTKGAPKLLTRLKAIPNIIKTVDILPRVLVPTRGVISSGISRAGLSAVAAVDASVSAIAWSGQNFGNDYSDTLDKLGDKDIKTESKSAGIMIAPICESGFGSTTRVCIALFESSSNKVIKYDPGFGKGKGKIANINPSNVYIMRYGGAVSKCKLQVGTQDCSWSCVYGYKMVPTLSGTIDLILDTASGSNPTFDAATLACGAEVNDNKSYLTAPSGKGLPSPRALASTVMNTILVWMKETGAVKTTTITTTVPASLECCRLTDDQKLRIEHLHTSLYVCIEELQLYENDAIKLWMRMKQQLITQIDRENKKKPSIMN